MEIVRALLDGDIFKVMKKPFSLNNLYKFICDPASLTHPLQLRLPVFLLSPEGERIARYA